MENIKFTSVKLISYFFALIGFILIISCENSLAAHATFTNNAASGRQQLASQPEVLVQNDSVQTDTKTVAPNYSPTKTDYNNSILRIFFNKEKINEIKRNLIDYGNKHLPVNIRSLYISMIEISFENSIIFIFMGLILFFIVNLAFVLLVLRYTAQRKSRKIKFIRIFNKMYEEVLLAYLFQQISWEKALIKLKRRNKRANRKILIKILLNLKSNFKGEMEQFVEEIYTKLNLHYNSLKLANSVQNYKKVLGIMELTHLYPEGAKDIINKLINDSSNYVRSEAQIAYIRLNQEYPFDFFYTLQKPFSTWTQLSAFNLIRLHQLPVPSFARFLEFKNSFIQSFSLKMITYFQQLESVDGILKMLENDNVSIRFLAYKAINDLRLYDSRELIKGKFAGETEKNRTEIVKALRNIGTADDFDFLFRVIKNDSVSLKIEACRAMYYMSKESREQLLNAKDELVDNGELFIAHVTDSRN